MKENSQFIVIESEAFYALLDELIDRYVSEKQKEAPRWLTPDQAKEYLNVADSTLYQLRVKDKINYTQPSRKIILYDRISIDEYLEANASSNFKK